LEKIVEIIKSKLDLTYEQIKNIITLLDDGSSIAFIARYRKDFTGNATDEVLIRFYEEYEYALRLLKRKEEIESILKQRETLSSKLQELLNNAKTLTQLEDIYEPYKGTKNTRADDAIKKGLTGLANIITTTKYSCEQIEHKAKQFLNNEVKNINDAIAGAKDIIALRYSQELKTKDAIRRNIASHGVLVTKATKTFQKDGLYKDLVDIQQKASYIKSHRLLAIFRALNEKQLNVKIEVDEDYLCNGIKKYRIKPHAKSSAKYLLEGYIDGLKRLLLPSLKREYLNTLKSKASSEACELFGKNLSELLLTPPLVNQVILGIDPGYKTGCKCAVIDKDGHYIDSCVIYLLNEQQIIKSSKLLYSFIQKYKVTAIAIGNGTASKETARFISQLKQDKNLDINYAVVSEIGASVYSASKIAQEEYPTLDVTIRGAISIASRLRDPMSALVKIDPKSLGIGQYQHDINQKELFGKLESTTTQLVNKVGVDINSASYKLLSYVSGISEKLAKNIIEYRDSIGGFQTKEQLLKVKGVGAKAYEQCVGFIRIKNGKSYLDNTGIHPESYTVAKYLKENYDLKNISNDKIEKIAQNYNIGTQSLQDIIFELQKPGYDIREELEQISFCEEIKDIEQLQEGDFVNGIVRNITDFGAFVDIGLKNDALLHISKISSKRISHPMDILSVNQQLKNITIDSLDKEKNKVGLSLLGNSDATHYK
jgi:uncharacterized protein